ncbi:hypothetical protein TNCV_950461 [Trichonephila clavipes]|nr:hypothetical protein TNCV_950461 [Trichonephila clavipes]
MKHCELLKIFLLFGVLTVAKAFRLPKIPQVPVPMPVPVPIPAPAISPMDTDYDKHFYPCYTSINCVYRGTDEHKRVAACVGIMDKRDIQIALNFYNSSLKADDYKDPFDTVDRTYCQATNIERKKVFQTITAGAVQMYGLGCELRYSKSTCDHFKFFAECLVDLFTLLNEEGKCDIEEFERKSS